MSDGRGHRLGDVLREAREAKGVDLPRVERETKIRERYLSALERGEYRELPGPVYTRGFLRNYGAYLGLDPDELVDLFRIETATATAVERPRTPAPRPLAGRRSRAFVVTPGALLAAILTIVVGAVIAYLAFEIITFARIPELRVTDPPGNVNGYTRDQITIRGVTAPNATVTVANLRENPEVTADADGRFEVVVPLVPGSNVVRLTANDPVTQRDSAVEERTIIVASDVAESPTPDTVTLELIDPEAGATSTGDVQIRGTAAGGATVTVGAQLVDEAAQTFEIVDAAGDPVEIDAEPPAPPEPGTFSADATGAFSGTMALAPGSWELEVRADAGDPLVRSVTVTGGDGLTTRLEIVGGDSYLELDEDGAAVDGWPGIASDGDTIGLDADEELRVRAGNAGAVRVTINGVTIGEMGEDAQVVEWRIRATED